MAAGWPAPPSHRNTSGPEHLMLRRSTRAVPRTEAAEMHADLVLILALGKPHSVTSIISILTSGSSSSLAQRGAPYEAWAATRSLSDFASMSRAISSRLPKGLLSLLLVCTPTIRQDPP